MKRNFDKTMIKQSFSRAAATYDEYSDFQKEVAGEVWELVKEALCSPALPSTLPPTLLDVGCGTGGLLEKDRQRANQDGREIALYGCDLALPMLTQAREKLGTNAARLISADMEQLPFTRSSFDILCSSLTYQWAVDTEGAFKEALRILKPGGFFCLSTLGPATLHELKETIQEAAPAGRAPEFMEFSSSEDIGRALKNAGFEDIKITLILKQKNYADLPSLLRTLKKIGATNPVKSNNKEKHLSSRLITRAAALYASRFPACNGQGQGHTNGIRATYDVILITARRPL